MNREKALELFPVFEAYANGGDVQYLDSEGVWSDDIDFDPFEHEYLIYRIKPKAREVYVVWDDRHGGPEDAYTAPKDRGEARAWTAEELGTFIRETADGRLASLWRVAAITGMRRGEILGLRWIDADLRGGTLAVVQSRVRGEDGGSKRPPRRPTAVAVPSMWTHSRSAISDGVGSSRSLNDSKRVQRGRNLISYLHALMVRHLTPMSYPSVSIESSRRLNFDVSAFTTSDTPRRLRG